MSDKLPTQHGEGSGSSPSVDSGSRRQLRGVPCASYACVRVAGDWPAVHAAGGTLVSQQQLPLAGQLRGVSRGYRASVRPCTAPRVAFAADLPACAGARPF